MLRQRRLRGAQSMVEFALMLPLIAVLVMGLAEFGFLIYAHVTVANATREGGRAASLYLGSRMHYTAAGTAAGQPTPQCWDLEEWVENALVEHTRDNQGCPNATFQPARHSFGRLSPDRCTAAPVAGVAGANCWWLVLPLTSGTTPIADFNPTNNAPISAQVRALAGQPISVVVLYRYNLPLVGGFIPFLEDPIVMRKTAIMLLQAD